VRAYLQAGLARSHPQRWYYMGPMFRRERPQKGRLRQFQQIGVEWMGVEGPLQDAETLAMAWDLITTLDTRDVRLEINSLGCGICRPKYRKALLSYLEERASRLCETCRERMRTNPLRVLDCKLESCQQALAEVPETHQHLCADCHRHFDTLQGYLKELAVPYVLNGRIVRGLDYYTRTAFEIVTGKLGAQGTVIAGGRYDGLVADLGGPETPAIGFALGLERLAMLLPDTQPPKPDIAVVALGDSVAAHALQVAADLRQAGCSVIHCDGGVKRQFKTADREGVRFAAVIGEDEVRDNVITLKNMLDGRQQALTLNAVIELVQKKGD